MSEVVNRRNRQRSRFVTGPLGLAVSLGLAAVLAGVMGLFRSAPVDRAQGALPQEAYVWQRAWRGAVQEAVTLHATHFAGLCLLRAEVTWQAGVPQTTHVELDYDSLRTCPRPLGLALRIGPFSGPFQSEGEPLATLAELAAAMIEEAQTNGLSLHELQLDFDCAESRLAGYQLWVETIRHRVAPVPVVITALPSWLKRKSFAPLADAADGFVLQVHSVEKPRLADPDFVLCDPVAARAAVEQAARLARPFRVALPTYGYRVGFDGQQKFVGLSAEGPSPDWPAGTHTRELSADPVAMSALVRAWSEDRPAPLRGIVWYRLPVLGDQRNWSWATLAAVMRGEAPEPAVAVELQQDTTGLIEVELSNRGNADGHGPFAVELSWHNARRVAGDALAGFGTVLVAARTVRFEHPSPPLLRPGQRLAVGWLRLDQAAEVRCELVRKND